MSQTAPKHRPDPLPIETAEAAEMFCGRFYKTIEHLHDLIERETRCLRDMEIAEAEVLQKHKAQLAQAYLEDMSRARAQAEKLTALAPESLDALRRKHEQLRQSLLENEQILEVIRSASQSLIRRAAERVAAKDKPSTYSPGAIAPRSHGAAAVALDRKL